MKKKITTDQKNQKRRDVHKGSYRPRGSQTPPKQQPPKQQPPKQQPPKQQPPKQQGGEKGGKE